MYVVIQKRMETKATISNVYRECEQVANVEQGEKPAYKESDMLIRDLKPKYDIRLKDKTNQYHIATFTYWDIVDSYYNDELEYMFYNGANKYLQNQLMDLLGYSECNDGDLQDVWNNYRESDSFYDERDNLHDLITKKFMSIIDTVIAEYEASEEYEISQNNFCIKHDYNTLYRAKQQEQEQIRENVRKENEKRTREEFERMFGNSSGGYSHNDLVFRMGDPPGLKNMMNTIIMQGYKTLSKKLHPDIGGNHSDFTLLGKAKDKLIEGI